MISNSISMPGSRISVKYNEIDIYNMIDEIINSGLYLAERRENFAMILPSCIRGLRHWNL